MAAILLSAKRLKVNLLDRMGITQGAGLAEVP